MLRAAPAFPLSRLRFKENKSYSNLVLICDVFRTPILDNFFKLACKYVLARSLSMTYSLLLERIPRNGRTGLSRTLKGLSRTEIFASQLVQKQSNYWINQFPVFSNEHAHLRSNCTFLIRLDEALNLYP